MWLLASHATATAGVLTLPIDVLTKAAALAAIAAHAWYRRPRAVGRLVAVQHGLWALPDRGAVGLRVSPATQVGLAWIELRLEGAAGRHAVLLCRDQFSAAAWRQLQARIRADLAARRLS